MLRTHRACWKQQCTMLCFDLWPFLMTVRTQRRGHQDPWSQSLQTFLSLDKPKCARAISKCKHCSNSDTKHEKLLLCKQQHSWSFEAETKMRVFYPGSCVSWHWTGLNTVAVCNVSMWQHLIWYNDLILSENPVRIFNISVSAVSGIRHQGGHLSHWTTLLDWFLLSVDSQISGKIVKISMIQG